MDLPAQRNQQARRTARGADNDGPAYLQHTDGTWSLVGPDGWKLDPADVGPDPAQTAALPAPETNTIDVDPISVRDSEIQ